jgi:hypothetical protein
MFLGAGQGLSFAAFAVLAAGSNGSSERRIPPPVRSAYDSSMNPLVLELGLVVLSAVLFWLLDRYVRGCGAI